MALTTLIGGISYIYYDGIKTISKEEKLSQKQLTSTVDFFQVISTLENYLDLSPSEINTETEKERLKDLNLKLETLPSYIGKERLLRLRSSLKVLREKRKIKNQASKRVVRKVKGLSDLWLRVESELSKKTQELMAKEKELAPSIKNTLSQWSGTFPFLGMLAKKVNLTYLEKDDVSEIKELLSFSGWLGKTKDNHFESIAKLEKVHKEALQRFDNLKLLFLKSEHNDLKAILNKTFLTWIDTLKTKEQESKALGDLEKIKKSIREVDQGQLISFWQKQTLKDNKEETLGRHEQHRLILDGLIVVAVGTILFSMLIFLKIFPQLRRLEKRAKSIGEGKFNETFTDIPKNEIGAVMTAFNEMSIKIKDSLERITLQQKEKAELSQKVQEMRHLSELGEASAKMAHELKNPLSILNFCLKDIEELVKRNKESFTYSDIQKDLDNSLVALRRLQQTMEFLGPRKKKREKEKVLLKENFTQSLEFYQKRLEKKKIQVSIRPLGDGQLMAPPLDLMGAFTNLFDNALEYFDQHPNEKREIKVWDKEDNETITLYFATYGEELKERDKVFNSFFTTKDGPLRGLGLGVVRDIVEECNGKTHYFYRDGLNTFALTFPTYHAH